MRKQVISAALCAMLLFGAADAGRRLRGEVGGLVLYGGRYAFCGIRTMRLHSKGRAAGYPRLQKRGGGRTAYSDARKGGKNYTLVLSDLKSADGKTLKESFSVYHQKYRNVAVASRYSAGLGWYPDALLPMAKAEEYGENKISAGENQGVTVSCKVPAEQDAANIRNVSSPRGRDGIRDSRR
ncbi:MAG: hypothetical protein ACLRSW_04255 [Christensenellaceae bacterium]